MELTARNVDNLLAFEALDESWSKLPIVVAMAESAEAAVAPGVELFGFGHGCRVALARRDLHRLLLGELDELLWLDDVLAMRIVVAESAVASDAPSPQALPRRQTHRVKLTARHLLDKDQSAVDIVYL